MKVCARCIYGENIPDISFDSEGICNYCRETENLEKEYPDGVVGETKFLEIVKKIKKEGKNKKYDCVVGVSGGCDSSYLIYLTKKYGLRPLAAHFDNTWNSSIASRNIQIVLKKLNVDLYTYVVDNEEFNDLAKSFLEASVPEIDALSDIGLATTLYMAASKYNIKYIFNGHNFRTEGLFPLGLFYFDGKYIDSIHKKYGKIPIKTFPNLWLRPWLKLLIFGRYKRLRPLYYLSYNKEDVKKFLNEEFGWEWYGGQHMENKYTIFCNYYILPKKFGIDRRYVEFSALIRSGQMTREEAMKKMKSPVEIDLDLIEEVKKRLNYTDDEFERIMSKPKKTYKDYQTYHETFKKMRPFFWLMYKLSLVPKSFYIKYTK